MGKKIKKGLLIIFLGVYIQMNMYSYVKSYGSTRNTQAYITPNRNIDIKIISATSKTIKIELLNKSDDIAYYTISYTLYKYKRGKWEKIKKISKTPKSLCPIKKNGRKTEKIVCKKHFGKNLSKGKYKIKWIQSRKFTIK